MADLLYLDTETRSRLDLKRVGSFRYAEEAEIILTCAALNQDSPTIISDLEGQKRPKWLLEALREAEHGSDVLIVGSNFNHFDREIFRHCEGRLFPVRNIRDLMFLAYRHGMPGSLDMLCEAMGVPEELAKSSSDYRFSKPLPPKRAKELGSAFLLPEHDPVKWAEFRDDYSWRDIAAMQWIYPRLPTWGNTEIEETILELDMQGQCKGLLIDRELAAAGDKANKVMVSQLKKDAIAKYGVNPASPARWMEMVRDKAPGFHIPNGQKGTVAELLDDPDFPEEAAEMLRIYGIAMSKAASKYAVMLDASCKDGRVRGTTVYGGAYRSLRDAGRLIQTQNLASRGIYEGKLLDAGVTALKRGTYHIGFKLPKLLASAIRPCIVAAPGNKLVVADFGQIEARFVSWLAGQENNLEGFRAYDESPIDPLTGERTGYDIYQITASAMFGVPVSEVTKFQRSVGKVSVLALGYAGGVGAYISMAKNYGIDLDKLAETVLPQLPEWALNKAVSSWEWHKIMKISRHGLKKDTWVAIQALVKMWRKANSQIEKLWHDCEDAAIKAMRNPGMKFGAGAKVRNDGSHALKFWRTTTKAGKPGRYLCIELPSGRIMSYRDPKLKEEINDKGETKGVSLYYKGKADGKAIAIAKAKGKPLTGRQKEWWDVSTFGGKLVENCIAQGTYILQETLGYIPIEEASPLFKVWDGQEWVSFDSCVLKGNQTIITAHGVRMTPDHLVLTEEGWKSGATCERYNRAEGRLPDGEEYTWIRRAANSVELEMRVWKGNTAHRARDGKTAEARSGSVLWLHEAGHDIEKEHHTWNEPSPGLCSMAFNARSLSSSVTSGMEKLRWTWRGSMRAVEYFRTVLVGYGANLPFWKRTGTYRQLKGLFAGKLPLAYDITAGQQPAQLALSRHATRQDVSCSSSKAIQNKIHNPSLEAGQRLGHPDCAWVYDLVNCGPRNRFAVFDCEGNQLIVHNCTQAGSRDRLMHTLPATTAAGYLASLKVHDEVVAEVPDSPEFSSDEMCEIMGRPVGWDKGLPVTAAGFETYSYRK